MKPLAELGYDELLARAEQFLNLRALDDPGEPTGAMVALIPTAADAARLTVEGGESADTLHVTLAYLGLAADITAETRVAIVERMGVLVAVAAPEPVAADGFALSLFNPSNTERDTCIVLGVTGGYLDAVHDVVMAGLAEIGSLAMPEQHAPWMAHLTLVYTDDAEMMAELVDKTGPVSFDRLRVAFGGEVTDIPLAPAGAETRAATYGDVVLAPDPAVRESADRFLRGLPQLPPEVGASLIQTGAEE